MSLLKYAQYYVTGGAIQKALTIPRDGFRISDPHVPDILISGSIPREQRTAYEPYIPAVKFEEGTFTRPTEASALQGNTGSLRYLGPNQIRRENRGFGSYYMLEGTGSNFTRDSMALNLFGLFGGAVVTPNVFPGPVGEHDADLMIWAADAQSRGQTTNTLEAAHPGVAGERWTHSVYAMCTGSRTPWALGFRINAVENDLVLSATLNWQRYQNNRTLAGAINNWKVKNDDAFIRTMIAWGSQLEKHPYATSFIRRASTTNTVSRAPDYLRFFSGSWPPELADQKFLITITPMHSHSTQFAQGIIMDLSGNDLSDTTQNTLLLFSGQIYIRERDKVRLSTSALAYEPFTPLTLVVYPANGLLHVTGALAGNRNYYTSTSWSWEQGNLLFGRTQGSDAAFKSYPFYGGISEPILLNPDVYFDLGNRPDTFTGTSSGSYLLYTPDSASIAYRNPDTGFRFEQVAGHRPRYLLEGEKVNTQKWSEVFTSWSLNNASGDAFVAAIGATAPDGENDAMNVHLGVDEDDAVRWAHTPGNQFPDNTNYTLSAWAKVLDADTEATRKFSMAIDNKAGVPSVSSDFTATKTWQRFSWTANLGSGGSTPQVWLKQASDIVEKDLLFWGAQFESGSGATSYIPVRAGTAVTRSADFQRYDRAPVLIRSASLSFVFWPTYGSSQILADSRPDQFFFNMGKGGAAVKVNNLKLIHDGGSVYIVATDNVITKFISSSALTFNAWQPIKVALALSASDGSPTSQARLSIEGATTGNGTTVVPTLLQLKFDDFYFGSTSDNDQHLFGRITDFFRSGSI